MESVFVKVNFVLIEGEDNYYIAALGGAKTLEPQRNHVGDLGNYKLIKLAKRQN